MAVGEGILEKMAQAPWAEFLKDKHCSGSLMSGIDTPMNWQIGRGAYSQSPVEMSERVHSFKRVRLYASYTRAAKYGTTV